jgi:hypothetical protein
MTTPTPQDPPNPTDPHSPPNDTNPHWTPTNPHFYVTPASSGLGPQDMWAVQHKGITLARWDTLDHAEQDAADRYQRWLSAGQPDPTPPLPPALYPQPTVTVPSVTELLNSLDAARIAFEQATPTGHLRHQIEGYAARLHLAEQDLEQERRNHAGMSRGELDRLRKVEAALVDLGAPNHSTRDDPGGPMITWVRELVAERDKLTAELAALNSEAAILPDNWRNQVEDHACDVVFLIELVESWRGQPDTEPTKGAELSRYHQYVAALVLAAGVPWPGATLTPDEVPAAVQEAVQEIKRLRAEATRALRSGSNTLRNAATRMENRRRELVALLRNHPGGGLLHEPENWAATLDVVRAHLVHRKLDRDYRTNLIQALARWLTAGEPVADWQMVHLVTQLANQAADRLDAAKPDPSRPVTFIDPTTGRQETYTVAQIVDAMKHSDKAPRELCGCKDCVPPDSYPCKARWLVPKRCPAEMAAVQPVGWTAAPAGWLAGRGTGPTT